MFSKQLNGKFQNGEVMDLLKPNNLTRRSFLRTCSMGLAALSAGDLCVSAKNVSQMKTFITMRAMAASPLMMGGDLPTLDEFSLSLITNREMVSCNQNGVMGKLVYERKGLETWLTAKKGTDRKGWVAIFNRTRKNQSITMTSEILGLNNKDYSLHEIWSDSEMKIGSNVNIEPNGCLFIHYK
jgi:alpha-galactosidase